MTSCNTLEEIDETSFKLQTITRNTTVRESFSADTSNDADTEEMDLEEVQPDYVEDDLSQVDVLDDRVRKRENFSDSKIFHRHTSEYGHFSDHPDTLLIIPILLDCLDTFQIIWTPF